MSNTQNSIDMTDFSMSLWGQHESSNTGKMGQRSVKVSEKGSNFEDFISMFSVGIISLGAAICVCYFLAQVISHPAAHIMH